MLMEVYYEHYKENCRDRYWEEPKLFLMLFRYDPKTSAERLELFLTPMVFAVATESRIAMCC